MPRTDIELDTDLFASLNDRGDLTNTADDNDRAFEQRAILHSLNIAHPYQGNRLTDSEVEQLRSQLQQQLANDDVLDEPISVTVKSIEGSTVTYSVDIGDTGITISIP